jgi:hypothetical protein
MFAVLRGGTALNKPYIFHEPCQCLCGSWWRWPRLSHCFAQMVFWRFRANNIKSLKAFVVVPRWTPNKFVKSFVSVFDLWVRSMQHARMLR